MAVATTDPTIRDILEELEVSPELRRAVSALIAHRRERMEWIRKDFPKLISLEHAMTLDDHRATRLAQILWLASEVDGWRQEQMLIAAEAFYIGRLMEDSTIDLEKGRFPWRDFSDHLTNLIPVMHGLRFPPESDFEIPAIPDSHEDGAA